MCDKNATSKEHAPPRCIFPATKDLPAPFDYRQGLITVPSCDEHNTNKSRDDEYLLYLLAASVTSSEIGLNHFLSKVRRAAERKPRLTNSLASNAKPVQLLGLDTGSREDGLAIKIDGSRIDATFANCARALYFFETKRKFLGPVKVITPFMMYLDRQTNESVSGALAASETFFAPHPAAGQNPSIFNYKFVEGACTATMLLCFYGSTKILVQFDKR